MTEPLVKTPRIKITPTETPAPPWASKSYVCDKCGMINVLEPSDVCVPVSPNGHEYLTPPCPTPGCGHVSKIYFSDSALALMRIGLEPDDEAPSSKLQAPEKLQVPSFNEEEQ